jgi:3-isopropylmalate/(R)-2-methylmalate dehydratase large subunit
MASSGMTVVEKILSRGTGTRVEVGEFTVVNIDLVFAHDGTAPLAIDVIRNEIGHEKIFDPSKVVFVIDHASPSPSVGTSTLHIMMRNFARKHGIKLYDVGSGICHQILPENGRIKPGNIIIGADSHTVTHGAFGAFATGVGSTDAAIAMMTGKLWLRVPETIKVVIEGHPQHGVMSKDIILSIIGDIGSDGANYKAMEFHGEAIGRMSIDSRMAITNMVVEMGAKAGIIPADEVTIDWLRPRTDDILVPVFPDQNAEYVDTYTYDISDLEPMVSIPPNVDNVRTVTEVEGVEVDQVFIGSCTGGRFEDFLYAAKILKGRRVKDGVRCIVSPASREVYSKLIDSGIVNYLIEAGCIIGPPTCGPCVGAHMGILGPNEVAVSTSNRNFYGRMGDRSSKVYLVSPAVAAASAVEGKLADPRRFLR